MKTTVDDKKRISVAMVSNAMNHHQFPFCDGMQEIEGVSFNFIATKPISKERLDAGFTDLNSSRSYIIRAYESEKEREKALTIANECDFVIYGSAPFEYIKGRIKNKKWTFIYSERLFKESRAKDLFNIKTIVACVLRYSCASHKSLRLLCSSAFSSNDFKYFRFKEDQAYKWGYFPPKSQFDLTQIRQKKYSNNIIWVGRMVPLKHPELVIQLAKKLKENNIDSNITIVGDGVMMDELKQLSDEYGVSDKVKFKGALSTSQTREEMEKAGILVTTSDHNEGWGAIVNEGMASGCAVVASHLMGSVPFLIRDGENGLVFKSGNINDLYDKVKRLLENERLREEISQKAYDSIQNQFNGEIAAQRLTTLMREYLEGNESFAFDDGICSIAKRMKNNWYN